MLHSSLASRETCLGFVPGANSGAGMVDKLILQTENKAQFADHSQLLLLSDWAALMSVN